VARITVQEFVSRFGHVCGVTATATEDQEELRRVYGFHVVKVPPYVPCRRLLLEPVACVDQQQKLRRIVEEARHVVAHDRAVLIGTRTIEQSEAISRALEDAGVQHVVLNARQHAREARIVAAAGRPGQVTVATNMAGRGTHIPLDPVVRDAGGLHVIVAEMNTAARIDAQLIGRCARQGDPGTARVYIAPDDQVLRIALADRRLDARPHRLVRRARAAQKQIQREHQRQRNRLTAHESKLAASLQQLGLCPYLDAPAAW
jgi:preprotein translocase subunit SecA